MSVLTQQYATFLQQFSWSYFLTARTPYKVNLQTPINWSNRLLSNDKVDRVFYSVERDMGDWTNKHVHMLVGTNRPMSYNETRSSLGNIAVGDYELIESPKAVTNYVTKFVDRDCEYDLIFNSSKIMFAKKFFLFVQRQIVNLFFRNARISFTSS